VAPLFADNSITIYEKSGSTQTNYPVQVGRPFVPQEIANCPQAVIGGTPVTTQANVMSRWLNNDNSVKHAIISFLVPSLPANGSVTVTFQNQASSMAQTIIIADHTQTQTCNSHACSKYDIGFDANHVFRPIIYATFWPWLHKVKIRFVGEITNTEALEDQTYSLVLKTGKASPAPVYSHATFTHIAMSRWTVAHANNDYSDSGLWVGGSAPGRTAIDHGFPYLISTTLVPQFDTTKGSSILSGLTARYATWQAASPDIYVNSGQYGSPVLWLKAGASTGDSGNLGMFTQWVTDWLYSMSDPRSAEIALGNADIGGAWPFHLREGSTTRKITRTSVLGCPYQCNVVGTGRMISVVGRDDFSFLSLGGHDAVNTVGTITNGGWTNNLAHATDSYFVPYLLTGEHFYYEELMSQAAWALSYLGTSAGVNGHPAGGYAALSFGAEIRGVGWSLRNIIHAAAGAVDGTPERSYLETAVNDIAAVAEGEHGITGTAFQPSIPWAWGNTVQINATNSGTLADPKISPLHMWMFRGDGLDSGYCDATQATDCSSPWMESLVMMALGRGKELGYPFGALVTWFGQRFTDQITINGGEAKWLIGAYRQPMKSIATGGWFATWHDEFLAFPSAKQIATTWANPNTIYAPAALCAVSYLTAETNGSASWLWLKANVLDANLMYANATDARWALVARVYTPPVLPTITSASPLPNGVATVAYSYQFAASGTTPFTWVQTGTVPGLTLSSDGILSGTPTTAGSYVVTVTASNAAGSASATLLLTITPAPGPVMSRFPPSARGIRR
jgi:hypothetical protein